MLSCCSASIDDHDALSEPLRKRSFTGFVAEVWFRSLSNEWAVVVSYAVLVHCVSAGSGRFAVSVPVMVPGDSVRLVPVLRSSRVWLVL